MPGLIVMNNSGAQAREGESRKRNHDGKLVNGDRTPRPDAAHRNGATPASGLNGAVTPAPGPGRPSPAQQTQELAVRMAELPPELAHIPEDSLVSLNKLFERAAQETFNDLHQCLHSMADLPIGQLPNGALTNGVGGHANGHVDNSDANMKRKLLIMNFAQEARARFIKLLVINGWAKKTAAQMSKLFDIFEWEKIEYESQTWGYHVFQDMKTKIYALGQRNPDIRTALQVLSKGKADWIPDLNFIPVEPISPTKALKLLRYMNTTTAVRLHAHEQLPRHLRKWRIASGRATFVVDSEFEMDLITFTEDTSAQWHFIDMRLLFSPAPEIGANSRFQFFLKLQADNILAQKGLEGCFSFLHNLVLTHKIGILRSQAYELSRGGWFGALKVEPVRRSLVVQYWVDRPGKKNWIEIGVSSNKPKNGKISWRGPPISSLVVRWFRNGKEVKDVDFKFDFKNLSMERMLKKVIALHIGSVLRQTKDGLAPTLRYHTSLSEQEPSECSLEVSLGRLENKTTLCVEPRSGRYVLQPCTAISARAEHAINHSKDPATPPINIILTQMLAQTLQDSIQRHALQLGWKPHLRPGFRMDTMKQATKLDVLLYALYSPSGWTKKWVLAAVIDASGETWWFMELGGQGSTIEYAEQLKIEKAGPKPPINRTTLASIERIAVKQLAFCVNRRECQKLNLESAVRNEMGTQFSSQTQSASLSTMPLQGWSLYIQTSDLLRSKPGENAWLDPCIRVTSQGFSSDYVNVSHIASGTMVKSVSVDMQKLMSASPQSNFVFSENGNFAILLTTPFGEPIVDKLKARLRDVDRLRSFASILHKRKMRIRKSSLQQVQFQYGPDDRATVTFLPNDEMDVSFAPTNPHQRIRMFLREIINERPPFRTLDADQTGLDHFCTTLIVTRPLLAALTKLEEETAGNLDNPAFYPHSVTDYRLTYSNPKCEFNIQLRQKDDNVYWYIRPGPKSDDVNLKGHLQSPKPGHATWIESLKTALDGLFKESGKGWFGVGRGLVARVDGVNEALARLQKVVLACAMEGGWKEPSADTKTAAQAAQTAAPPQAQAPTQRNSAGAAVGTAVMAGTSSTARPASSSTANANGGGGSGSGASVPNLNSNSNPTANSSMRRNFPNVGRQGNGSSKQDVIELD